MIAVPVLELGLANRRQLIDDLAYNTFLRITTDEWGESITTVCPMSEAANEMYGVVSGDVTLFTCPQRPLAATYNESTHTLTVSVEGGVP